MLDLDDLIHPQRPGLLQVALRLDVKLLTPNGTCDLRNFGNGFDSDQYLFGHYDLFVDDDFFRPHREVHAPPVRGVFDSCVEWKSLPPGK